MKHTVTHRNPDGWHVVATAHDPGQAEQHPAALVRDPAHAEAVAELLTSLTSGGASTAAPAAAGRRGKTAKAKS